jgi:splicing factor 45
MKAKLGKPAQVPAPQTPNQENVQEAVPTSQSSVILHKPADEENTIPPPPPPAETAPGVIVAAPTFNPEYYDQKRLAEQSQTTDVAETAEATPEERTSRPGQTGFAERLMKKLGWEKGQGLGASGEGITTALQMKAEKRKKKSDYEGGGFVTPVNMGKIVGGKKAKVAGSKAGDEGAASELENMSEVVKLKGMLENMDVDHEIAENNLMQEIGDEMGEQYGKVERLFIWRKAQGGDDDVFVKFTSPLSAVRCLKGMDGVEFAGNQVTAGFWDADMFERGEYDKSG